MLNRGQLEEFAERGFLVLPQVVPGNVVAAASRAIDELVRLGPPDSGAQGPYNYFEDTRKAEALTALLAESPAFGLAEALTGPGNLAPPGQLQVALNIPPFPHRPGLPHIDGAPCEADGRPGTFTMLAGVLMSDQREPDSGNLWVWPGSHLTHAEYFRANGPDAFFTAAGYPPVQLPEPEQVTGQAGDLVLAHYLLGHNIGGNTSAAVRRAVYYRLKRPGHNPRWRQFLQDPWLEYDPVRAVLADLAGSTGNTSPC
jgi:hypothetical protein